MEFEISNFLAVIVAGAIYYVILGIANRKRARDQ